MYVSSHSCYIASRPGNQTPAMPRRKPYTRVTKVGQVRPAHVRGMGDVVFKVFQCVSGTCQEFVVVREDNVGSYFEIICPRCGFAHQTGGKTKLFDYALVHESEGTIEEGEFTVLHDSYIREAGRFKYCLYCYALRPLEHFDRHNSRKSGRQGECSSCKAIYNGIKNQSRTTDQHREASAKRRLYGLLAGDGDRIDSKAVFDKFEGTCFKCNRRLQYPAAKGNAFNLDHTLPVRLLWPLETRNATLLCATCNNEKHGLWPSEVYSKAELRRLARLTSYEYGLLAGEPRINESAIGKIVSDPDRFIEDWIRYPNEIMKLRRLIQDYAQLDIFEGASHVPDSLLEGEER